MRATFTAGFRLTAALSVCAAGSISTALAEDQPAADPYRVTVYIENDVVFLKPNRATDRNYTNGFAIELSHRPDWADDVARQLPGFESFEKQGSQEVRTAGGYVLGHQMYTPSNLNTPAVLPNDHPYAGYLYGGAYVQRDNGESLDHFQLDLGVVGESALGEPIQDFVHQITDSDDPLGWDNQIADEFTAQAYVRKHWHIDLTDAVDFDFLGEQTQIQLLPMVGVALGQVHRNAEAGATLRIGGNLPDDYGPSRLLQPGAAPRDPEDASRQGWSGYGYGRATVRAVQWNMFLDGNNFGDTIHSVDSSPLLGEFQAGVAIGYQADNMVFEIDYSQTFRTREFDQQPGHHEFGSLNVSLTFTN